MMKHLNSEIIVRKLRKIFMKVPPGIKKSGLIPNLPYTDWGLLTKKKAIF